jgi:hypothetical protein
MQLSNLSVKLSRNSWHRKLQLYTFGSSVPLFPNLCPYFWLTIACLFVGPLKYVGQSFKHVAEGAMVGVGMALTGAFIAIAWPIMKVADGIGAVTFWLGTLLLKQGVRYRINRLNPFRIFTWLSKRKFAQRVATISDEMMLKTFERFVGVLENIDKYMSYDDVPHGTGEITVQKLMSLTEPQWDTLENNFFKELSRLEKKNNKKDRAQYREAMEYWNFISAWRVVNYDWEERQQHLVELRELQRKRKKDAMLLREQREREHREYVLAQKEALRQKMLRIAHVTEVICSPIIKVGKPVVAAAVILLATGAALWLGYKLLQAIYWVFASGIPGVWDFFVEVYTMLTTDLWGSTVYFGSWTIVGIGCLSLVYWFFKRGSQTGFFASCGKGITGGASAVGDRLYIFFAFAKAVKEKQCPGIQWEEQGSVNPTDRSGVPCRCGGSWAKRLLPSRLVARC